jgi:sec-independent protein translocase protein TatC
MTLLDHLLELRMRLTRATIAVLVGFGVGFWLISDSSPVPVVDYIIKRFVIDLGGKGLNPVTVGETFTAYLSVGLLIGIVLAMPVIVYQLLAFLTPGLLAHEKRVIFMGLPFVLFCFVGGLLFGWFVTVPAALEFLLNFGSHEYIIASPSIESFFSIFTRLMLINGIVFELPVVIFLLARLGVINPRAMGRYRRYVILAVTVIAAIVTPTSDPANLALVAVPMYLLYELGLLLARLVPGRREKTAG